MSLEENKQVVRNAIAEFWNAHDLRMGDKYHAEGFINQDPSQPESKTLADLQEFARQVFSAFPDLQVAIEDMIAEGDKVAVLWMVRGTHQGEYKGLAPTGRTIALPGASIHRIRDGQIAETQWRYDSAILLQQLSQVSTPVSA